MSAPDPQPSLADRLRSTYGEQVDPEVNLGADGLAPRSPGARDEEGVSPPSSGLLERLDLRAAARTRYRVEGEVARGGMGAILQVWDGDLRRRAAMKVALSTSGSGTSASLEQLDPRLLARFLEEAQVTGQLEHPGIVPVHELGIDENGQVYFTMRLVRGRTLEEVFALVARGADGWSRTRALGVLLKVCEAMAYAHSKGVVHRDLKPANVMVGEFGEVYVMDWGLVRVKGQPDRHDLRPSDEPPAGTSSARDSRADGELELDPRQDAAGESSDALYTMDGDVLGTPAYMPPEQARGELDSLDERSDVYALGAMLYHLLTGHMPYGRAGERRNAVEVLTDLLEGPPTSLDAREVDAPSELVAVCEKAMARDPARRYADMSALGADLQAFLEGRVVSAFEAGALAEARKWIRRNRPLAAALAAALLALIGGLAASLLLKQRADRSAEEARQQAEVNAAVNAFLNEDLLAASRPGERGVDLTVREVLDSAALSLEGRFPGSPLVEAELRHTIGDSYERLGEYDAARPQLVQAVALREASLGRVASGTLASLMSLGDAERGLGNYAEAAALYEEAALGWSRIDGPEAATTLSARSTLANILRDQGRLEESEALQLDVAAVVQRRFAPTDEITLETLLNLSELHRSRGRLREAAAAIEAVYRATLELVDPAHPRALIAANHLALVLQEQGEYERAEELFRAAHEARLRGFGPNHPNTALGLANLGVLLTNQGRLPEAAELLTEALAVQRAALGPGHPDTLQTANSLAVAMSRGGNKEAALEKRLEILAAQEALLGREHPETLTSMGNLAVLYMELERYEEALALAEETHAIEARVLGPDHPTTLITLENLGNVHFSVDNHAKALELVEQVLAGRRKTLGPNHPDVAKTTFNVAMVTGYLDDPSRKQELLEEAIAIHDSSPGDRHYNLGECHRELGIVLREAGEPTAAIPHFERAVEIFRDLKVTDGSLVVPLRYLLFCHADLGDFERAIEFGEESLAVSRARFGDGDRSTLISLFLLSTQHRDAGRPDEALRYAREFQTLSLEHLEPGDAFHGHAKKRIDELEAGLEQD